MKLQNDAIKYIHLQPNQHETLHQCGFNVAHRLRHRSNIKPTLFQHLVFSVMVQIADIAAWVSSFPRHKFYRKCETSTQCWLDGGPTSSQHWMDVSYFQTAVPSQVQPLSCRDPSSLRQSLTDNTQCDKPAWLRVSGRYLKMPDILEIARDVQALKSHTG